MRWAVQVPEYDFSSLSPPDFEHLVRDVLNAEYGYSLASHPAGRDYGIDLRGETETGEIVVVQCKHYAGSTKSGLMRAVRDEAARPRQPVSDRYIFVTSFPLLPQARDEILGEFAKFGIRLGLADVWGRDNLNDALGRHPEVERRHFKLWLTSVGVLESILDSGRWQRAEALYEQATAHSRLWVAVPEYGEALHVLERHGVCVLTGPPGVGKSFLAEMLLLAAVRRGWTVVDVSNDIDEAWRAWRPGDEKQLFYYDDFLGRNQLEVSGRGASRIGRFIDHLRGRPSTRRILLTVREQILRQSTNADDAMAGLADEVIRLGEYSQATKAHILFNHLYFSRLNAAERARLALDDRIRTAVGHPFYNPRIIEGVTKAVTEETTADELLDRLLATLFHPRQLWHATFQAMDPLRREILLTLATLPFGRCPVDELLRLVHVHDAVAWTPALRELEPTWIRVVGDGTEATVTFANPSCLDYVLTVLDDPAVAAARLAKVQRLDQLAMLTLLSGLPAGKVERPQLADVLRSRRAEIMSRAKELEAGALGDLLLLARAHGSAESTAWVFDRVEQAFEAVPLDTSASLDLAAQVHGIPSHDSERRTRLVHALVTAGVAVVKARGDLDAYEVLSPALVPEGADAAIRESAKTILRREFDDLLDHAEAAETLRADALELQQQARRYGVDIDVAVLLDRAEDLAHATDESGQELEIVEENGDGDGDDPDLSGLFSRLR